jgi:anaerobic magnesium-protoporphyrin IX monomethyl ester cyclase
VLVGEGLSTLRTLIERLNTDPQAAAAEVGERLVGVVYRQGSATHASRGGPLLPASDSPSFPAWDLIDLERYRAVWKRAHGYFSLNMAASRGCSFRCNWCAKPTWGNHYLQRDPVEVAREMAYLRRSFQPDHIWFADDIFGFRVDWVLRFAAAIELEGARTPFTIQSRADLMSRSMAHALRSAHCAEVWIGAESGSQRVLDSMNKGVTVEQVRLARERLRAEGIRVGFFIQLGYLDEQLEDILATRQLIEATRPDDVGVSVSYPLPGTRFYELVKQQLQAKTHWQDSNDLEMMFEGTYNTAFYRAVRDLLHDQVAAGPDAGEAGALERRWDILMASEPQCRNARPGPVTMNRAAVNES